jgi:hypothetical protein
MIISVLQSINNIFQEFNMFEIIQLVQYDYYLCNLKYIEENCYFNPKLAIFYKASEV